MQDLHTRIQAQDKSRVYVDQHDTDVWLSTHSDSFSSHVVFTKDQAKDLIAALIRIVDAEVTK